MEKVSIILSIKNRAHLFQYCLEAISRQDYDPDKIEICVGDYMSNDNLVSLIDRHCDKFRFKYTQIDKRLSYLKMWQYNPSADYNTLIKNVASHDYIIKIDPEVVMKDPWVISEIMGNLESDDSRMYNARCHFTEGDSWYMDLDDILTRHEQYYHFAEGGPFTRSKFYFCSGFSKQKYIELGGVDELFCYGVGYDDTCLREHWKNRYGAYEKEITGQVIHLWHGVSDRRPTWEKLNERIFNYIKGNDRANIIRLDGLGNVITSAEPTKWGNPNMLSRIYTISKGEVIRKEDPTPKAKQVDLPFAGV